MIAAPTSVPAAPRRACELIISSSLLLVLAQNKHERSSEDMLKEQVQLTEM